MPPANHLQVPAVVRLTLPLPPSTNRIWRHAGRRTYRSADYVAFVIEVQQACIVRRMKPTSAPVEMTMTFYFARKNGDASNRIKALEDALNGFAYVDDLQVVRGHWRREMDRKNPRVEIEIREVRS